MQSLGAGVLAEQQHSLGRRLSYKRCGLHRLQLKPCTQSTVTHLGCGAGGELLAMLRGTWECPYAPAAFVPGCPAHLLLPGPAGGALQWVWCWRTLPGRRGAEGAAGSSMEGLRAGDCGGGSRSPHVVSFTGNYKQEKGWLVGSA